MGWKAGYGIAEVQELIGSMPVPGHLTTATLYHGRAPVMASHADVEVVATVGSDELAVALEFVDPARPPGGVEALIESNVMHRAFALGPPARSCKCRSRPATTSSRRSTGWAEPR